MSNWWGILKRKLGGKKLRSHIVNTIDGMPEWEVTDVDPNHGKNGRIDFTEEPEPTHTPENEPHNLFPPSSPKNMDNYMRRLPATLRQNAQGRGGFRTGARKLE